MPPMDNGHVAEEGNEGGAEESVKVFVRIRPLNKRELAEKQTIGWDFNETSMLEDTQNGQRVYAYDHCFGPNGTNKETYEIVGQPVVLKAMEGYNGTVFTYGQTGSGKTWTMRGCESDPGMMILCIRDILNFVKEHPHIKYTLKVSYLEVYNEEINDLLGDPNSANSKNLKIVSEDSVRGAVIGGLVEEVAQTPEDFMAILKRGESSRSYASTEMNNESSRSHTIYRVTIESQEIPEDGTPPTSGGKVAYLNLVDLAGSERQKSTKAEGKTLKEGSNINKSLLALGAVINKLGEATKKQTKGAKPVFIPYRDSKLTRILKQSLGGNTLTSMLCAVTPAPMHREETVSTLKFGQLCKSIKNSVKSNDGAVDEKTLMKQYRNTIADLKAKLEAASKGIIVADPESSLGQAIQDKMDLQDRVRQLEAQVIAGGGSVGSGGGGGGTSSVESSLEAARLSQQVNEQAELINVLQRNLEEFQDLEEARAAFEEYQHHSTQELDEGLAKLEEEKQTLQNERYKMLKDRSNIDEKETRIGLLITNLDEKESKLRQMMGTMKEQQDQWQRSITDLQRREDLVDDWQTNHTQREKRLQETDAMQERKFAELNKREADLSAEEQKFKIAEKELKEREARLQVALSRVSNSEQTMAALEDKLNNYELQLKKRENDSDIRDRELLSRRKEMESWDVLLREKDRKISVEQRNLDERETAVRATEDKMRQRDIESERRLLELRQNEAAVAEQAETLAKLQGEVELRDRTTLEQMRTSALQKEELSTKESELMELERQLRKLQERMSGIEQREAELKARIQHHKNVEDEFFNVKVAQITSRHGKELARLEALTTQQLKIAADYRKELDAARLEISQKCSQIEEFEVAMEHRNNLIEQLREHLSQSDMASLNTYESGVDSARGGDGALSSDDEGEEDSHGNHVHNIHGSSGAGVTPSVSFRTGPSAATPVITNAGNSGNNRADPAERYAKKAAPAAVSVPNPAATGQEFIIQLATTRKMLYNILEKHDAVPDRNASWGRRNQRNAQNGNVSNIPVPVNARGGYVPQQQAQTPYAGGNNPMDVAGGPGTPLVSQGYGSNGAQQGGASNGGAEESYNPADPVSASDAYPPSPPVRDTPHQFQRQTAISLAAVGAGNAAVTDAVPANTGPSPMPSAHVSPLNRQSSQSDVNAPLSPFRHTTAGQAGNGNGNGNTTSPFFASAGAHSSAQLNGAMAEEKDSGSVRSGRRPVTTPTAAPVASTNTPNQQGGTTRDRASPYSPLPARSSPYTASSGAYSPNLSALVKTGEKRNGVPVTTVNLGYSSGIKRGTSFRDSINNANSPTTKSK